MRRQTLGRILLALTFGSGMLDAVAFVKLGAVFVANMTGNVVLLGLAFARVAGPSLPAALVVVSAFALGSLASGRAERIAASAWTLLRVVLFANACLVAAAALVLGLAGTDGPARYAVLGLLAGAMGAQGVAARRAGVADLSTTVVTQDVSGLGADSRLAGGRYPHQRLRLESVSAMLLGALLSALLMMRVPHGPALAVGAVGALQFACLLALRRSPLREVRA